MDNLMLGPLFFVVLPHPLFPPILHPWLIFWGARSALGSGIVIVRLYVLHVFIQDLNTFEL